MVLVSIIDTKRLNVFSNGEFTINITSSQCINIRLVYNISVFPILFIYIMVVMSVALALAGIGNGHSGHTGHFGHNGHIGHIGHIGNLPVAINQFVIMSSR